ncbi:cupredoxin family copper-binding protein [Paenibacillus sp.]|uniref:cupredoxin domain-containing protein n=1 Tax=Paenibacillus sp. TaxID=58172 RepID=UPI002D54069D|nr:cupredoxin family copper-binding protein [Paenibacillus sp.]HZG56638.1 cupredoxin family copper-binding protein [Paenibacillus sp.]
MRRRTWLSFMIPAALSLLLAGCGGAGAGEPAASATPNEGAATSVSEADASASEADTAGGETAKPETAATPEPPGSEQRQDAHAAEPAEVPKGEPEATEGPAEEAAPAEPPPLDSDASQASPEAPAPTEPAPPAAPAEHIVEIVDFAFSPERLEIQAGDTVVFVNKDAVGHTATADDGSFDTGMLKQDEKSSVVFDKAGEFSYICTPHPGMKAVIVVK